MWWLTLIWVGLSLWLLTFVNSYKEKFNYLYHLQWNMNTHIWTLKERSHNIKWKRQNTLYLVINFTPIRVLILNIIDLKFKMSNLESPNCEPFIRGETREIYHKFDSIQILNRYFNIKPRLLLWSKSPWVVWLYHWDLGLDWQINNVVWWYFW